MKGLHAAKRWMYRHDRPGRAAWFANRIQALAASSGYGVRHVVTLEVPGRRTGKLRSFPVVVADNNDQRYLVAILGENTNWIRNVEAAGGRCAAARRTRAGVPRTGGAGRPTRDPGAIPSTSSRRASSHPR
jgi:hypothetical protein